MGEDQEQRYICRICSKICVSGKSLGGHMRVHLSQIAASKKAAQEKEEEEEISMSQSISHLVCEPKKEMEAETSSGEMEDGDQSNIYELRENPKKSWRITDPKHAINKNSNPCKECGREFASLRALSGHMRCHSIKNRRKEVHHCKECGRGFDTIRAMFGHMKSHSKRVKHPSLDGESAESLSDLENFCPVRRKRSRIRYKGTVNPSFSASESIVVVVSEVEEAEEAAKCLVMLSRGVRSCSRLDSTNVESDDDDAYFGGVASCRSKKFKEFDDHELDLDKLLVLDNVNDEFLKSGFENEDDLEMNKQEMEKTSSNLCRIGSLLSVNGDDELEREMKSVVSLSSETGKSKKRECPICFKVFASGQALGGHKRAHYNGVVEGKNREAAEEDRGILDLNFPVSGDVGFESWFVERKHEALMLTT